MSFVIYSRNSIIYFRLETEELIGEAVMESTSVKPITVLYYTYRPGRTPTPIIANCINFVPRGKTRPGDDVCPKKSEQ